MSGLLARVSAASRSIPSWSSASMRYPADSATVFEMAAPRWRRSFRKAAPVIFDPVQETVKTRTNARGRRKHNSFNRMPGENRRFPHLSAKKFFIYSFIPCSIIIYGLSREGPGSIEYNVKKNR